MSLFGRRFAVGYSELSKPGRWPAAAAGQEGATGDHSGGAEVSL